MNDKIPGLMNDNGTLSTSRGNCSHEGGESDPGDDLVFADFA